MFSENESEFPDLKVEFTDPKASLNQFDTGNRISSQNLLIIFQNFKFLTYLSLLKLKNGNVAWIKRLMCMFS